MVWQTIKNIFACRTTVKKHRKRATKMPAKVKSAPASKTKKTPDRRIRRSPASKKSVNPASESSASGILINQRNINIPLSTNNNSTSITGQESPDRHLPTNQETNFENIDRDTLLSILHSFEQHHPEEATLLYQSLLQLLTRHIPLASHTNADNDRRTTKLHTVIQDLRDVIDSLNIIRAGQPAHAVQSQSISTPTTSTRIPWTHGNLFKTITHVTFPATVTAAAAFTLTYTHPHLFPESWSTLFPWTPTPTPTASPEILTWNNHVSTIISDNLETHGVEAIMWLVQTAMRSYFHRERQ